MYDLHLIFITMRMQTCVRARAGSGDITEMSEVLDFGSEGDGEAGVYGVDDAVLEVSMRRRWLCRGC